MHFSGRVRAGEVMPLDRGLLTAGKGKGLEATADGVCGKGFAFPWAPTALEVQDSFALSKAKDSKEAPDFVCPMFGFSTASVMPGLQRKHTLMLVDCCLGKYGESSCRGSEQAVKSQDGDGFQSCANR